MRRYGESTLQKGLVASCYIATNNEWSAPIYAARWYDMFVGGRDMTSLPVCTGLEPRRPLDGYYIHSYVIWHEVKGLDQPLASFGYGANRQQAIKMADKYFPLIVPKSEVVRIIKIERMDNDNDT